MENMMPYLNNIHNTNDKDFLDMDTLEHIRSVSECSIGGTSGYNSTTSPGPGNSPNSLGYSPVQSPDSALQTEFSNLAIPKLSPYQQNSPQYIQLQNVPSVNSQQPLYQQTNMMNFSANLNFGNPLNFHQFSQQLESNKNVKYEYEATLRIAEQPVEKFRFRYKSEMHGTHGSLNGISSQRNTKTFPEVELCGYKGPAIIRCSLFQTNLESPHSHQLVIRKDDHDICDPHELKVSQGDGYFAEFKNMGIIHTAKKFIVEELLKKKRKRLLFELGRDELPVKEEQELVKQTEKEAKDMNLNQVRLCFEAFRLEENNTYTPIAAPVFSNPINNRKSAQTGELRITRLSIATGSVGGGDDLILLVEKVSKKNIKVRFYEMVDDEQVWEAFASFRESDVHHQYAIVCRTPAYKDKNIDKSVEVFIELVRPSDDERSFPPVSFRYKPSTAVINRKRRRTCSSLTASSCSNSGSLSSGEIPKTVQDQVFMDIGSAELSKLLNEDLLNKSTNFSGELSGILKNLPDTNINLSHLSGVDGRTETDGASNRSDGKKLYHYKKSMISKKQMDLEAQQQPNNSYLQRILKIFNDTVKSSTPLNKIKSDSAAEQIKKIFHEYSEKHRESLIHEIVATEHELVRPIFRILEYFKLNDLLNSLVNKCSQTALHYCCLYNQPIYIRPLLKLGCNPDIQDNEGNTALHIAVRENHLKCLESFINSQTNFDLKIKNDDGFTPLHLAIRDSNLDIVAKLLKYDGSIVCEPYSKDGNSALHMAIQQQNQNLVTLVLNNNSLMPSILYAQNTAGQTPLDLAKLLDASDDQSQKILDLLLTYYNKHPRGDQMSMEVTTSDHVNRGEIIIKEENSCSSTEDDDEDNASNLSSNEFNNDVQDLTTIDLKKEIEIKEEFLDDTSLNINDVEKALNDTNIYTQLCNKLNQNDKWKKLATEMKMLPFYLANAEGFLNSLKRNLKTIDCNQFAVALENIDKNLINLIRNQ